MVYSKMQSYILYVLKYFTHFPDLKIIRFHLILSVAFICWYLIHFKSLISDKNYIVRIQIFRAYIISGNFDILKS